MLNFIVLLMTHLQFIALLEVLTQRCATFLVLVVKFLA